MLLPFAVMLLVLAPRAGSGFSVLAHQGIVDESWQGDRKSVV